VGWQRAAIDIDEFPGPAARMMDMPSEQLFPGPRRADQQDGQPRWCKALDELRRPLNRGRYANDWRQRPTSHCCPLRGSRGAVTLSASASVLRIRGVRKR